MKIGIDARFLTHPQVGGFKTYTENLVKALSRIDSVNRYLIYIDRPANLSRLPQNDNITYKVISGTFPVFGMPIREQIGLRRSIAEDDLDVVHFLCNTAPVNVSEKFVVTLHDVIQVTNNKGIIRYGSFKKYKERAVTAYSKWTILKSVYNAEAVITVSNYEKIRIVKSLHLAPEKIRVTHLAPNPIFAPAASETKKSWRREVTKRYGLCEQFLLGIGYEKRKNIGLLIKAFARLAPHFPDLGLVIIAAKRDSHNPLEYLISRNNITERVVILPEVSINDLVALYNLAEIFVYPSEREGFGLPPLEALGCGTPTIAMNLASLPEILGNGALMINGKDPQTWEKAIKAVLTNSVLREDLVKRGLRQAAKMTWEQCAEKTLQIYQAVAKG